MNIDDLVTRHGGYFLHNKGFVTVDGNWVTVAVVEGSEWVLTEEGAAFVGSSASDLAEPETKPRERKVKIVESVGVDTSAVDIE